MAMVQRCEKVVCLQLGWVNSRANFIITLAVWCIPPVSTGRPWKRSKQGVIEEIERPSQYKYGIPDYRKRQGHLQRANT